MTHSNQITVRAGYHPQQLEITAGEATTIVFRREERGACSRELVFPTLGLRRELPTGESVAIDIPASAPGTIPFTCGMNMMRGEIIVRAA